MNRLKRRGIDLGLIGFLVISGCDGFTIGGLQPTNRSKSAYKEIYLEKANSMDINKENARELIDCYGSLKELDKMDNVVKKIVGEDLEQGISCGDMGDIYHSFFKTKPKKQLSPL